MAKGITIELKGLDSIVNKVKAIGGDIAKEVDMELGAAVVEMVNISSNLAPVNNGFLRNSISDYKAGELAYEFVCSADYAAYIEFGTKTYVRVPKGLESYAAQFRGGKGSRGNLFEAIKNWLSKKESGLRGKELDRKARYISYVIATKGIKPQPFFFPAYYRVRPQLLKKIKAIVNGKR